MSFIDNQNYESTYKYLIDIEPIHQYTFCKTMTELDNLRDHVKFERKRFNIICKTQSILGVSILANFRSARRFQNWTMS